MSIVKYYEPEFFCVQEYVPPEIYKKLGDKAILLIDRRVLKTDDELRRFFGKPITINNWHRGGNRKYSGFRPAGCKVGARYSQHKYGRASDKLVSGMTAQEVRDAVIKNIGLFPHISVIENSVEWLHTDCRCIAGDSQFYLINP